MTRIFHIVTVSLDNCSKILTVDHMIRIKSFNCKWIVPVT